MIFASWALSAASLVYAARSRQPPETPSSRSTELPPLREAVGRVERVDLKKNAVVVDGQLLRVDQTTTIFVDGRTGTLTDLTEGQLVRAAFELGPASPVAQWIEPATDSGRPRN